MTQEDEESKLELENFIIKIISFRKGDITLSMNEVILYYSRMSSEISLEMQDYISYGNKAAGKRVRVYSGYLTDLLKEFRVQSVKLDKNSKLKLN